MVSLARNSGITWNWHDEIAQSNNKQQYNINIKRTFSTSILVDGNEYVKWVTGGTVDDVLTDYGIILTSDDDMNYKHGDVLFPGIKIEISRVSFNEYVTTEEIPFGVKTVEVILSASKPAPANIVGVNGIKSITRRETIVNGVVTSVSIINETIEKAPIEAVNYNVKTPSLSGASNIFGEIVDVNHPDFKYKRILKFTSTAYSGDANSGGPRAANGEWLAPGSCAIDPRYCRDLKMGDKLYVVSTDGKFVYGYAQLNDTGAGRLPNWIDLYIPNEAACNNWGRRDVYVYVLN